jgi:hypothetical protein
VNASRKWLRSNSRHHDTMNIRNLTPHAVTVCGGDGKPLQTIQPSGQVARVSMATTPDTELTLATGLPVVTVKPGQVTGLPDPQAGVMLLVSMAVRVAVPHRRDVLSPGELVRGADGQPVGCRGLVGNGGAA